MLYQVSKEWEYNGRDDSDFYVVAYDPDTDSLARVEVGSTRYGGPMGATACGIATELPEDIKEKARLALRARWEKAILASETDRVMHATGTVGEKVRVKAAISNRPRAEISVPCNRCSATGKWINPNNTTDQRDCYSCRGKGSKITTKATKGASITIPEGTTGEIVAFYEQKSKYGTWSYSKTAVVKRADGSAFRARLQDLRLDEEVDPVRCAELLSRHENDAYSLFATANFGLFGSRL